MCFKLLNVHSVKNDYIIIRKKIVFFLNIYSLSDEGKGNVTILLHIFLQSALHAMHSIINGVKYMVIL